MDRSSPAEHHDHHDRTLRLRLDVQLDRQPIAGRLGTVDGTQEESFEGWLGFADALRRLRDRAVPGAGRPDDGREDA